MSDLDTASKALQAHLVITLGAAVLNKEDSSLMKAVALGFDVGSVFASGLPKGDDFMNRYATTLARDIYLPKLIRENPLSLCEVMTHECEHVLQFAATHVEFAWFYLTDQAARAQFEADAYASGIAVRCWLTGEKPESNIPWVLESLVRAYHLRPEDKTYAESALKSHVASLNSGIYMTRSARTAIDFLSKNYPDLKGAVR